MRVSALLAIEGLQVRFGGVRAVDGVSLTVDEGESVGIIGPNGAGKTTLINAITGFARPNGGRASFAGAPLLGRAPHSIIRAGIARTFQNLELFEGMTVVENVMVGLHSQHRTGVMSALVNAPSARRDERAMRARADEVLDEVGLREWRDERVELLPYGIQKLVELARAIASRPRLLLLDEPAAGLNTHEKDMLRQKIDDIRASYRLAVLVIDHDVRFIERLSNRMYAMNFGTVIAAGRPAEVLSAPPVVTSYLGEGAGAP